MTLDRRNPASGGCGAREIDQLGGTIVPEDSAPLLEIQARWIASRFGLLLNRAQLVAELAFHERAVR